GSGRGLGSHGSRRPAGPGIPAASTGTAGRATSLRRAAVPEGLSPSEVGKEIAEHHKKEAEKAEERANGSATEAKGHDRLITIIEAVLLAVVAVLAAYSGFAAAKWGTESSLQLAKASAARTEANRAAYQAADLRNFDS